MCLVTDNQRLVTYFVRWFRKVSPLIRRLPHEDAVQEANLALMEAAGKWDPDRAAFSTCYRWYAKKRLLRAAREYGVVRLPSSHRPGSDTVAQADYMRNVCSLPAGYDKACAAEAGGLSLEDREALEQAMRHLRPGERRLLHWYYWDGLTFAVLGRRLGVSRELVRKRMGRLLARLRKHMKP